MRKHTVHCGESRSNGEQGKVGDAGRPFVANSQRNELGSYKGKAREQGKGQESRETQHFSENSGLPFRIVAHLGEHRLCHGRNHPRKQAVRQQTPFVGLRIISYLP